MSLPCSSSSYKKRVLLRQGVGGETGEDRCCRRFSSPEISDRRLSFIQNASVIHWLSSKGWNQTFWYKLRYFLFLESFMRPVSNNDRERTVHSGNTVQLRWGNLVEVNWHYAYSRVVWEKPALRDAVCLRSAPRTATNTSLTMEWTHLHLWHIQSPVTETVGVF